MITEIDKDVIRLLVLDVSGAYSKIYDEVFVPRSKENEIGNKYNIDNKYIVIRTL